jgi:hypothetical protein
MTMKSNVGVKVVDAHSHFFTAATIRAWAERGRSMSNFEQRTLTRTDMKSIDVPDEDWDAAEKWVKEMDKYGVSAIGFMVGPESYDEFLEAKKRFPGRLIGYANVNPSDKDAVEGVRRAGRDRLQGIKLYPSSWRDYHAYDKAVYPVYEEARKQRLVVFLHFGITIGGEADLRHANPIDIQLPSRDFPDLNFVIAHFGAGWFREALLMQYQADNVYMDSSGSNSWMRYQPYDLDLKKIFERAIRAGGAKRILFGTDSTFFPRGFRYNILEEQFNALKALSSEPSPVVTQDDIELIFHRNIERLTGFRTEE